MNFVTERLQDRFLWHKVDISIGNTEFKLSMLPLLMSTPMNKEKV